MTNWGMGQDLKAEDIQFTIPQILCSKCLKVFKSTEVDPLLPVVVKHQRVPQSIQLV